MNEPQPSAEQKKSAGIFGALGRRRSCGFRLLGLLVLFGLFWFVTTNPFVWARPAPERPNRADLDAKSHVAFLTQLTRDYRHPKDLNRAASYIEQQWLALDYQVQDQAFTVEGQIYRNVWIRLGPPNTNTLVIGAHYDVCQPYPGANDNASGIAALLGLSRLLQDQSLKKGVILVAFSLEEPPFFRSEQMGSRVFARMLKQENQTVSAMIALDCVGYRNSNPGSQHYPIAGLNLLYGDRANFICVAGRWSDWFLTRKVKAGLLGQNGLAVQSMNAPAGLPGIDFSDHLSFWQEDVPAVLISDTAFYRYDAYHQPDDRADRLDYDFLDQVALGLFHVVMDFSR